MASPSKETSWSPFLDIDQLTSRRWQVSEYARLKLRFGVDLQVVCAFEFEVARLFFGGSCCSCLGIGRIGDFKEVFCADRQLCCG